MCIDFEFERRHRKNKIKQQKLFSLLLEILFAKPCISKGNITIASKLVVFYSGNNGNPVKSLCFSKSSELKQNCFITSCPD